MEAEEKLAKMKNQQVLEAANHAYITMREH